MKTILAERRRSDHISHTPPSPRTMESRPILGTVKYSQNLHGVLLDSVHNKVWQITQNQLARICFPAGSPLSWSVLQLADAFKDGAHDPTSDRSVVVLFDVIANESQIAGSRFRPAD